MLKDKTQWLDSFRKKKKPALVVAVCSGKGGVGKTSIALRLAQSFSETKKKVLIVDCDFNLANTSIKLGLSLKDSFLKVMKNPESLLTHVEQIRGFDLLPGCNGDVEILESRGAVTKSVVDILGMYSHHYDLIILDAPAGASKESLNLIALADFRVFVITPEPSSMTDGYSLFKLISEHYGCSNNLLVVNRYQDESQWKKVQNVMQDTAKKYAKDAFYFVGAIPEVSINHTDFDRYFLETADNSITQSFNKIKVNIDDIVSISRWESLRSQEEEIDSNKNFAFD